MKPWLKMSAVGMILSLSMMNTVQAGPDEATAQSLAKDLQDSVSSATGVIGDLQGAINAGKATKEQVNPAAITAAFKQKYEKATGKPYSTEGSDLQASARADMLKAVQETVKAYESQMVKGGSDAFVPAYFRAQVLKRLNSYPIGKTVKVYATTRDEELINADSSVKNAMKGSPLIGEVSTLMASGSLNPVTHKSGDRFLGYWPMKLGAACVACHARNGLEQKEGGFGGALVVDVNLK